jgi:hypothetical protein
LCIEEDECGGRYSGVVESVEGVEEAGIGGAEGECGVYVFVVEDTTEGGEIEMEGYGSEAAADGSVYGFFEGVAESEGCAAGY